MTGMSRLPAHGFIAEPELKFHPERLSDVDAHPLLGLNRFGPYSRKVFGAVTDPIRLALISPPEGIAHVHDLLEELERRHQPRERSAYLVEFRGFSSTFGVRVVLADDAIITLTEVDGELNSSPTPHRVLADHLSRAIAALKAQRSAFDVVLIYLPERWSAGYTGGPGEQFDLHDFIKGVTATAALPAQILLEKGAMEYFCRCSVAWRLGIALYCKAGGIPWKLAHADPDTVYIGLGYALRFDSEGRPTFVTCCSQVFDHDGTGLEFVAYETADMKVERGNPFLTRTDMCRVMARSLALYQHQHGGRFPRRVIVHKLHPYRSEEMDGCFDALRAVESIDLVQVQKDAFWRGVHLDPPRVPEREKSRPGYACRRGSYLMLSGTEALLWTQGNVPQQHSGGRDFFKEMKGTPAPLIIRRFAGHGPMSETCHGILGLTKMDWNNDALYDRLPVTLGYASVLAQTLKRIGSLSPRPYPFRLFM
jgi:hypothetical protein